MMGRCILVLGVGRSGTSIIAGMLSKLGVSMGASFVPANRNNPFGTFEDREWFNYTRDVLRGAEPEYGPLIEARNGSALWGVKDPALARVAQYVIPHLDDVRVVLATRPRDECVLSFARAYGRTMYESVGWWTGANEQLQARLAEYTGPLLTIEYDKLLADPGDIAGQLAAFVFEKMDAPPPEKIALAAAHVRPQTVRFDEQKVAIGHPLTGGVPTWGLYKTMMDLDKPHGYKISLTRETGLPVDIARDEICRWFLEDTRADWLLMTDHDAALHPDTLRRMMSWDKPIVSALAFLRFRPCFPSLVYWRPELSAHRFAVPEVRRWIIDHDLAQARTGPWVIYPRPDDGLWSLRENAAYTGCHCVLFKRSALEAIEPPRFKRIKKLVGEDRFFFAKAQVSGVEAHIDMTTVVAHLAGPGYALGVSDFLLWDRMLNDAEWDAAHELIK